MADPTPDPDLAALRALLDAMTPGPWRVGNGRPPTYAGDDAVIATRNDQTADGRPCEWVALSCNPNFRADSPRNAAGIVALVNAAPALLARCEAAEAEVARLRALVSLPHCDHTKPCTCGSGGHPRRCERHPGRFAMHCMDLTMDARAVAARDEQWATVLGAILGKSLAEDGDDEGERLERAAAVVARHAADSARLRERERALVTGLREACDLLDAALDCDGDNVLSHVKVDVGGRRAYLVDCGDEVERLRALADVQPDGRAVDNPSDATGPR
jgi:hypothetical protein